MNLNFSETFNFFSQECFLARNSILSGFDFLLKTRLNEEKDGYFYSAFFQLSIGIERLLKVIIITDYMLDNNLELPPEAEFRKHGHDILKLYYFCTKINDKYSSKEFSYPQESTINLQVLNFLSEYAKTTRYYNLNQLSIPSKANFGQTKYPPIAEWFYISENILKKELTTLQWQRLEKQGESILLNLKDNNFTSLLDFDNQIMTTFDVIWRMTRYQKSIPHVIWILMELLKPTYYLMNKISEKSSQIEHDNGITKMRIPFLYEFFYFLLSNRSDTLKRKKWLDIFNR